MFALLLVEENYIQITKKTYNVFWKKDLDDDETIVTRIE